ncbi:MAG TPA: threonylcarbamoyl-AMP synthase [Cryomorphaceae bacterium]|nr:threonylcarbamoyl-AMP synthase [Cryomorphaceae bacterium]|tara:strand:- start:3013 stop:3957 length:945 start_codon:yes stop_codon:yes gene_type:complete
MAITTDIDGAVQLLQNSGLVALPTETVYGLGANAMDAIAIAKVFKTKNRPSFDPLIVHVASIDQAHKVAELNEAALELFERFSPGPLTLVLPKKDSVPDIVTSGHSTVAIRIPDHPMTLKVIRKSHLCIAAPSANPFGYTSPTTAAHVQEQLGGKIDAILDGGPCGVGLESTILDLSGVPRVLRLGGLALEELEPVLGILEVQTSSSNPNAPGMLSAHYNPGARVRLFSNKKELIDSYYAVDNSKTGVLIMGQGLEGLAIFNLSESENIIEAASRLFTGLRILSAKGYTEIWAHKLPDKGLGRAINDRLIRAAN